MFGRGGTGRLAAGGGAGRGAPEGRLNRAIRTKIYHTHTGLSATIDYSTGPNIDASDKHPPTKIAKNQTQGKHVIASCRDSPSQRLRQVNGGVMKSSHLVSHTYTHTHVSLVLTRLAKYIMLHTHCT
jgi:hypothetical protein